MELLIPQLNQPSQRTFRRLALISRRFKVIQYKVGKQAHSSFIILSFKEHVIWGMYRWLFHHPSYSPPRLKAYGQVWYGHSQYNWQARVTSDVCCFVFKPLSLLPWPGTVRLEQILSSCVRKPSWWQRWRSANVTRTSFVHQRLNIQLQ